MPESYNKDAYKKVYQHPQWRQTVEEYETGFARNLKSAPVVQDAARGALVRLSNMLNAYYGMEDKRREFYEQTGRRDMNVFEEQKALEEVAATVSGTTPKITRTLQEALLPDIGQAAAGGNGGTARERLQRDLRQNGRGTVRGGYEALAGAGGGGLQSERGDP